MGGSKRQHQARQAQGGVTKQRITIRLSQEVVERFRASGDGWQTRMDAALKEWLQAHSPWKGAKARMGIWF